MCVLAVSQMRANVSRVFTCKIVCLCVRMWSFNCNNQCGQRQAKIQVEHKSKRLKSQISREYNLIGISLCVQRLVSLYLYKLKHLSITQRKRTVNRLGLHVIENFDISTFLPCFKSQPDLLLNYYSICVCVAVK